MIGKAKSISHTAASIEYGKNKKEEIKDLKTGEVSKGKKASFEVDRNLIFGETAHEIAGDFKIFQRGSTIKNSTISFVVSPLPEIAINFTKNDWQILTRDFLNKMGKLLDVPNIEEQQAYISYVHTRTKARHLHIYMNRILHNNKPIKDSFIGKKANIAAEQIAKERLYKTAKQIRIEKEKLKNLESEAIYVKQTIGKVMKSYPNSLNKFLSLLKEYNISAERKYDSKHILRGLSFIYKDKKYKATELARNLSGNKIDKTLKKNFLSKPQQIKINDQNKLKRNNDLNHTL